MGRPKVNGESLKLTLPAGMTARIDAVRREGEDRLELIRAAIERTIVDRLAAKRRKLLDEITADAQKLGIIPPYVVGGSS